MSLSIYSLDPDRTSRAGAAPLGLPATEANERRLDHGRESELVGSPGTWLC